MVETMTLSLHVPHMFYSNKVNLDALMAVHNSLRLLYVVKDTVSNHSGRKLTYMPFFVKAASLVLTAFPVVWCKPGWGTLFHQ